MAVASISATPTQFLLLNSHTHKPQHSYTNITNTTSNNNNNNNNNIKSFTSEDAILLLENCCHNFHHLKLIHSKLMRTGLFPSNQLVVRKIIHSSFSFHKFHYARLMFNQIHFPETYTWNFIIRCYASNGMPLEALLLYNLMLSSGFSPDKFTFPFVVKACVASCDVHKALEVYGFAVKLGFSSEIYLQNTLMDLCFKCGDVGLGKKVFDKMLARNVVSWTTYVSGLIACAGVGLAREAFELMPSKNVVSWTAMIHGYVRNRMPHEAFELFWQMQIENVRPNEFTLVTLLKACTQLESLELGTWVHEYVVKNGFRISVFVGTALIDMYSKCGSLQNARRVFDEMEMRSLATWNTMITSLGVHGCGEDALDLFAVMEDAGVKPDAITFVGVLCACVRTNNIREGKRYFRHMMQRYRIAPILEHYVCMIQLSPNHEIFEFVNSNRVLEMAIRPNGFFDDDVHKLDNVSFESLGKELQSSMTLLSGISLNRSQYIEWDGG